MAENINFIPATDLPEATVDEVSVLCVENGELKQKSASGLGGNTQYDIVVKFMPAWDAENEEVNVTAEVISGSYAAVVEKLDAYAMPHALVIEDGATWGDGRVKSVVEFIPYWFATPDGAESLYFWGGNMGYSLLPDGSAFRD